MIKNISNPLIIKPKIISTNKRKYHPIHTTSVEPNPLNRTFEKTTTPLNQRSRSINVIDFNPRIELINYSNSYQNSENNLEIDLKKTIELGNTKCNFFEKKLNQNLINEKTLSLLKIYNFLLNNENLSLEYQNLLLELIENNLFNRNINETFKINITDVSYEIINPYWIHNKIIYDILLILLKKYSNSSLINLNFLKKLFYLTNLPDQNERDILLLIFKEIISNIYILIPFIIKLIKIYLINFLENETTPYSINVLLSILLNLYNINNEEILKNFDIFILNYIFPLITSNYLNYFQHSLHIFFSFCIENNSELNFKLFLILKKNWNKQIFSKNISFIEFLFLSLQKMNENQFLKIIKDINKIFLISLNSSLIKSIELILDFFLRTKNDKKILKFLNSFIIELFPTINFLNKNHWSKLIQEKSLTILIEFEKINSYVSRFKKLNLSEINEKHQIKIKLINILNNLNEFKKFNLLEIKNNLDLIFPNINIRIKNIQINKSSIKRQNSLKF